MLGSDALETAIGLALVFCLLSLVATSLRETIELRLQSRAVNLERGLRELLHDRNGTGLARALYRHPLVGGLYRGVYDPARLTARRRGDDWPWLAAGTNLPAYIPARNVALALMDLAGRADPAAADGAPLTVAGLRAGLPHLANEPVRRTLTVALDGAGDDLAHVRRNLERWFDSGMDRVSGWYRKQTQVLLFAIGLGLAGVGNVDALRVAQGLYANGDTRALVAGMADPVRGGDMLARIGCDPAASPAAVARCARARLAGPGLPIGWDAPPSGVGALLRMVVGWLVTAFAVSLGAPFWFDLLNKVMVIRSTVKPHEKSPEEASEDRR